MKFKKWTLGLAILASVTLCHAQTNTPTLLDSLGKPVVKVGQYLAANTNALKASDWTVAPYASYAPSLKHKYGGGLAFVYYFDQYVGTQIRFQYLDTDGGSKVWLPNGTITLQSAYQPFGAAVPITIRPMVEAGAASDLNGRMYAIVGTGGELDLVTSTHFIRRVSLFAGAEQWQGNGDKFAVYQGGLAVNMHGNKSGFLGLWGTVLPSSN